MPHALDRLVQTCLEKDRKERWQSARDLKRRLVEIVDEAALPGTGHVAQGPRWKRVGVFAVSILIIATLGWAVGLAILRGSAPSGGTIDSVVVLPFINDTGEPDNDYLSAGIAESIRNNLSQIATLRVIPVRDSLLAPYAEGSFDPVEIASEVGARAVVTGRVRQVGDGFVIQTDLIDALEQRFLWGNPFQSNRADILIRRIGIPNDDSAIAVLID